MLHAVLPLESMSTKFLNKTGLASSVILTVTKSIYILLNFNSL